MPQANFGITINNLARLPLNQLAAAYDAFAAAADCLHAVGNQPRVKEIAVLLFQEEERNAEILERIVEVASRAKPSTAQGRRHRLRVMMAHVTRVDDPDLELEIALEVLRA